MNVKTYCRISATIFTVVAIAHLTRVINGWAVQVDGLAIPMWISVFGLIVTGSLAYVGHRAARS